MPKQTKRGPRTFDGMVVPFGKTIKDWDNWPVEAKQFFLAASKDYTIGRITDVKALIHKIELSGNYTIAEIREKLGPVARQKNDYENYRYKYVRNEDGMNWTIHVAPTNTYWPNCLFVGLYPRPKHLDNLFGKLDELTVKYAEFTLDFMCVDRAHVAEVFNIFKRYLWISGYPTLGITRVGFINQTLYFGPVKLYERGSDNIKRRRKNMLWRPWQLDRVRLEFSASYDQLHLRGLTSTSAFIDNPRFKDMLYGSDGLMYRFAKFKDGAQGVPHEWEEYPPCAEPNANLGQGFQEQYKDLASRHAEPHKKVQHADGFDDVIDFIHVAIQNFSLRGQHDLDKLG